MNLISLVDNSIHKIKEFTKDFAMINGMLMESSSGDSVGNVPITILPSPFPEALFKHAAKIQKDFHILFNKISRDYDTLFRILEKVIETDDYIRRLWEIYSLIHEEGNKQSVFLGLIRNDYMVDIPPQYIDSNEPLDELLARPGVSLKQVEYNMIAASFSGIAQAIVPFHRLNAKLVGLESSNGMEIPANNPADGMAKGMICAWKLYNSPKAVIMFLVQNNEHNIFDHRIIEHSIYTQSANVRVIRRTFEECFLQCRLDPDFSLFVGDQEVAVVYFRAGYVPNHFYNEQIWASKIMIERSRAIKCPNIHQMLVNTKLVQQALTNYSLLRLYVSDTVSQDLMEIFADQYLLTDKEKVTEALSNPERFVLKPQMEGGGNNYFNDELVTKLNELQVSNKQHEYVLMQRIHPVSFDSYVLKSDGEIYKENIVSELGIFGVFLCSETQVYANYHCGHLLRSKPKAFNEGGISAGFGCLDSPYLI